MTLFQLKRLSEMEMLLCTDKDFEGDLGIVMIF
jgi:hypothetical protein